MDLSHIYLAVTVYELFRFGGKLSLKNVLNFYLTYFFLVFFRTQLCINTAIVYMQRFFMFHSFDRFHRNSIASASLFLAAKVEEQPRKLEHVIKVAHMCLHRGKAQLDVRSEAYQEQAQELVTNENILLQTLGFDVAIDHPHTHVVKCCQLVKAAKELAQTSYFMATNR